jgi:hypothetical protein
VHHGGGGKEIVAEAKEKGTRKAKPLPADKLTLRAGAKSEVQRLD